MVESAPESDLQIISPSTRTMKEHPQHLAALEKVMPRKVTEIERLAFPPELESTPIARCCEAWSRAFEKAAREGRGYISCSLRASEAYRIAMPPLTCAENIPGFIACVVHGLVRGVIIDTIATRLIHAAQVASRACKSTSRSSKAAAKTQSPASETVVPGQP